MMDKVVENHPYYDMCDKYDAILNSWYKVINEELFNGCLHNIELRSVIVFFPPYTASFAQYCLPKEGEPYMKFNLQGLINSRTEWIVGQLLDDYEPTPEDVEEEVKEIIAGSLIHEMIHQYSKENSITDVEFIDGIDVHTEVFKTIATQKGLLVLSDSNGESNTHIRPNHPILNKLHFDDFMEDFYPTELIIDRWSETE